MVVYGLAVNLPFIAIQRYNRLRVARVLRSDGLRGRRRRRGARATSRGTNGSEHPVGLAAVEVVDAVRVAQPLEVRPRRERQRARGGG